MKANGRSQTVVATMDLPLKFTSTTELAHAAPDSLPRWEKWRKKLNQEDEDLPFLKRGCRVGMLDWFVACGRNKTLRFPQTDRPRY